MRAKSIQSQRATRKYGMTSSSRGSRDGGGRESIWRRLSGCMRCPLIPVLAFPVGVFESVFANDCVETDYDLAKEARAKREKTRSEG